MPASWSQRRTEDRWASKRWASVLRLTVSRGRSDVVSGVPFIVFTVARLFNPCRSSMGRVANRFSSCNEGTGHQQSSRR